jgi:hypothetical protein
MLEATPPEVGRLFSGRIKLMVAIASRTQNLFPTATNQKGPVSAGAN